MRDLPLHALRAFAAVYSHGGVRAAARELGIAHSSVSRHLSELSAWLGVAVAEPGRGKRGLILTAQGELLAKATLQGLQEITRVASTVREARSGRSVTIAAAPSFAARWLLPRIPELESALPRIEVSVVVDQRLTDLNSGEVDFAIRIGEGKWREVHCEPLMADSLYPVMSAAYWQRSGRPDTPARLARLRLLHDRDPQASWESWRAAHGPKALDVRSGPRFASSDLVLRAAMQGQGVALARHQLAREDVASGALVRPLGKLSVNLGPSYWIVLADKLRNREAALAVVAWLKKQGGSQTQGE
ncbi:MAG TPA: LysR substrate-binding domain-containing protein [Steroidobacteraceae bacterium]|nr:LysR substrate-binding domain-containing protein [Steroidobacteraceae bacterium]